MVTLRPMVNLLQKALDEKHAALNEASGALRRFLQTYHSHLITEPELFPFDKVFRHIDNLRNPAVHSRSMTPADCSTSRKEVFKLLRCLYQ